ncbi:hypothetical protein Pr1d_42970 [Bythopirellula goksoeyrii]|uniref:Uncharacterized protein n=1 Tax=Bythopirellula goksoeyrii TaxID=1400387 RepID=A0A5B9QD24_9BACT|nr:hypothetical protein Pr1d_42970 [Bythopirellula goksoeyrii]
MFVQYLRDDISHTVNKGGVSLGIAASTAHRLVECEIVIVSKVFSSRYVAGMMFDNLIDQPSNDIHPSEILEISLPSTVRMRRSCRAEAHRHGIHQATSHRQEGLHWNEV